MGVFDVHDHALGDAEALTVRDQCVEDLGGGSDRGGVRDIHIEELAHHLDGVPDAGIFGHFSEL
jgi:hypothetical protein